MSVKYKYKYVNNKLINELWGDVDSLCVQAFKQALYSYCRMSEQLADVAKDATDTAKRLNDSLVEGYESSFCLMRTAERLVQYTERRNGYADTASQMLYVLQQKKPAEVKWNDFFADEYVTGC